MLGNYIKLALRNLARDRFYAAISVLGLSVGILCAILIMLYITDELSYDRHNEKHRDIYRLESLYTISGKDTAAAATAIPLGVALKDEYPEIIEVVRFLPIGTERYRYGEKEFYEERTYLADETVFDVFTHTFLRGSPGNALEKPGDIVLTESTANKYFGKEDPMGKAIQTGDGYSLQVTGIIADQPDNTHFRYDALVAMKGYALIVGEENFNSRASNNFWNISVLTYALTHEHATIQTVIDNFDRFHDKYFAEVGDQISGSFQLMATPLADVHFRTGLEFDLSPGNIEYIYIFATVAVFLLLIAAINYMNMATARSAKRAKEIGLRKVVGAYRGQIVSQFLIESLIISLLAMVLSVLAAEGLLPLFNQLSDKELKLLASGDIRLMLGIIGISVAVGLVSGSYPALYLSRFMPARILKSTLRPGRRGATLRKVLVVVQFTISIVMIIGTIQVFEQLRYLKNKDLGFRGKDILVLSIRDKEFLKSVAAFKEELLRSPSILGVATSSAVPGTSHGKTVFRVEDDSQMREHAIAPLLVDHDFLGLMGIELAEGRNFDRTMETDAKEGFVVNQALAAKMGWRAEALGKRMQFGLELDGSAARDGEVIGVVRDYNFASLHNEISPLAMILSNDPLNMISIRIAPGKAAGVLRLVKETAKSFGVNYPLSSFFLHDKLSESYRSEGKMGTIFGIASMVCIIVSSLGLLGLSSYMAEQRTKEIGIRKSMGATVYDIVHLFSKDFLKLVIFANLLAAPIIYYAITKWSADYPYRADVSSLPFVLAASLSLLVTIVTVGFQAFKASSVNPIESLRYE